MNKKIFNSITIIALVIIMSVLIFYGTFYIAKIDNLRYVRRIYSRTFQPLRIIHLDPYEFFLSVYYSGLFNGTEEGRVLLNNTLTKNLYKTGILSYVRTVSLLRGLLVLVCAIGILLRRNFARVVFLTIAWIAVILNLIGAYCLSSIHIIVLSLKLPPSKMFLYCCFSFLAAIFYIYYFTKSKIKELFK